MKLAIVIVSWNTRELLRDCLASVYEFPPACEFEVWVVDNASADGSVEMLRQQFPQVRLIVSAQNVGFAGGNNLAISQSTSELVLLLNPDTVVRPNALTELVAFMERPLGPGEGWAGAAGSRLLNPDSSLQVSCHPRPTLFREFWRMWHLDKIRPYGQYNMPTWDTSQPREVDVIQGASFIIRRDVLDTIGYLDDAYFMYSEEVDLCYRLQQGGWRLYWVPTSQVVHYGGQSTRLVAEKMFLQLYQGKVIFFRKHYGPWTVSLYKFVLFLTAWPRIVAVPLWKRLGRDMGPLGHYYWRLVQELPGM